MILCESIFTVQTQTAQILQQILLQMLLMTQNKMEQEEMKESQYSLLLLLEALWDWWLYFW